MNNKRDDTLDGLDSPHALHMFHFYTMCLSSLGQHNFFTFHRKKEKKRRALGEICATRVALLLGETKIVKKCKEFSLVFKQTRLINSLPRT